MCNNKSDKNTCCAQESYVWQSTEIILARDVEQVLKFEWMS